MSSPDAGGAGSSVCLGLVVLSRSLLAPERMPVAGSGGEKEFRHSCRISKIFSNWFSFELLSVSGGKSACVSLSQFSL